MGQSGLVPRRAALALVDAVVADRLMLSEARRRLEGTLSADDEARAVRLALTCLRNVGRADRLLGPHLAKKPPLAVHNMLRLAVCEIFEHGAPAHAVVDAAVALAKGKRSTAGFAGLVNAVLRKVAAADGPAWAALPPQKLPKWLRKPLAAAYGNEAVLAAERAHQAGAPLDLTVREQPEEWAARLGAEVTPTGSVRLRGTPQVSSLEGYESGAWWVQDAAAALPVQLLGDLRGKRVLDMCAAPGGKTMQLAAGGALVTAVDASARRMQRVAENLRRTGMSAELVVADAARFEADPFDAILLDAPCTATGTIRRHPDLPFIKDGSELTELAEIQSRLLEHAVGLLRPGGFIVYCTCSLLREEGEEQVASFLRVHPEFSDVTARARLPGVERGWIGENGLRTWPGYWAESGGLDGFFMALLEKGR